MMSQKPLLSIHRALIGNITDNMRAITVDYSEDHILLKYYLAESPESFESAIIDEIETEVRGDLDESLSVRSETVTTQRPIQNLDILKDWVYKRYEEPVEVGSQ